MRLRIRVKGLGFRVVGLGCRVEGLGFRIEVRGEGVSQSTAILWTLARVYAGHPVTVYHGVILKAIYFYCTISPTVTEWGQWQYLRYIRVMRYVQKDVDTCLLLPWVDALHGVCHNDGSLGCQ